MGFEKLIGEDLLLNTYGGVGSGNRYYDGIRGGSSYGIRLGVALGLRIQ